MSVAVIPYAEQYFQNALMLSSSADSDSDAGYGTPAETVVMKEKLQVAASSASSDGESSSTSSAASPPPPVVDSDLQEKIVKQVEWYFSDENLLKDSFLMKHINRNKQGYVSLKLVASLRKVKTLSKEWRVVLESTRHSALLALNEDETKIRRISPAPQVDFSHIAKTILITNYPEEDPNLADIEQSYGRYGEVVAVRIIYPGRAIPLDVKPSKSQHPSLGKELCILVEFESEAMAKSALKKICDQQSWRDEVKVCMLGEKSEPKPSKDQEDKSTRSNGEGKKKRKGTDSRNMESLSKQRGAHNSGRDASLMAPQRFPSPSLRGSREGTPVRQIQQRRLSPPDSASSSPDIHRHSKSHKSSPEMLKKYLRPDTRKDYSSDSGFSSCGSRSCSESPKLTPEPSRKFFSSNFAAELSWRSSDKQHSNMNSCIIRQPMGPDGTKGFAKHRISPISIAIQSC